MSKARLLKTTEESLRLPEIVDFCAVRTRQREWDNIVTIHKGSSTAYSWNKESLRKGKHTFNCDSIITVLMIYLSHIRLVLLHTVVTSLCLVLKRVKYICLIYSLV